MTHFGRFRKKSEVSAKHVIKIYNGMYAGEKTALTQPRLLMS